MGYRSPCFNHELRQWCFLARLIGVRHAASQSSLQIVFRLLGWRENFFQQEFNSWSLRAIAAVRTAWTIRLLEDAADSVTSA
jgi:hypothetical protein